MKLRNTLRKYYPVAVTAALVLASPFASAAGTLPPPPDVGDVVAYLFTFLAVIGTIGSAILMIAGTIAGFRFLRGAVR